MTTPLVAFVDSDVVLPDGWLDELLPHFDDPRVGLVAPRIRSTPGTSVLERYEAQRSPLDLGPEPARIRAGTRVSYVPAAAIVVRVDAIREVGGFDPEIRFGEDVDLVWRLDEAGWSCRYEPAVEAHHPPRPTWRAWVRQRVDYGSSAAPLSKRHPGRLAPVRMSGWSAGAWALAAVGHPLAGVVLGAGSAAALVPKLADVPPQVSLRIAGLGNLHAGRLLADAVRRVWWPIVLIAALRSRRARLIALGVTASPPPSRPPRRRHGLRHRRVEGHLARAHHRPPDPALHLLARPLPTHPLTRPAPVTPSSASRQSDFVHRRRRAKSFCPKSRTRDRWPAESAVARVPYGSCRPKSNSSHWRADGVEAGRTVGLGCTRGARPGATGHGTHARRGE